MAQITQDTLAVRAPRNSTEPAARGQADRLSPERLREARGAHRSYYRWLRLNRFAMAAFVAMTALLVLWLLPWAPSGLEADDYTPELAFTVYLLGGVAVVGVLVLLSRELVRRHRESLMVWAAVYDEATGLHNRTYLYDRLSLECERAERSGGIFSVIVLQIRIGSSATEPVPALSNVALENVADLINRLTHPADLVAMLSGSELAVLAIGVGREQRVALLERLRTAVAAELPEFLDKTAVVDVIAGGATYGVEGSEAGALVQAARTAATLALPQRGRAA